MSHGFRVKTIELGRGAETSPAIAGGSLRFLAQVLAIGTAFGRRNMRALGGRSASLVRGALGLWFTRRRGAPLRISALRTTRARTGERRATEARSDLPTTAEGRTLGQLGTKLGASGTAALRHRPTFGAALRCRTRALGRGDLARIAAARRAVLFARRRLMPAILAAAGPLSRAGQRGGQ